MASFYIFMSQFICFNQFSKFVLIHLAFLRLVGIELEFIAKIQVETMSLKVLIVYTY